MPGVDYYADLLRDRRRIDAFLRAIAAAVRPEDHVLDVGSGLGTFARAAAARARGA
jgi:predicted RNA methylase